MTKEVPRTSVLRDAELIARLREDVFYGDERLHNLSRHNPLHMEAADRIKELVERNKELALQLLATQGQAAEAAEAAEAKLATCEKYRDAYAEMGRIGTQAVRDLEAKLAENEVRLGKAVEALEGLIQQTYDCEKELTEDLHHMDFCGESEPLTKARATLAEIKSGIATTPYGLEGESHE